MNRRSNAEIRAEILSYASTEIKPTILMYRCNISWQPLQKHLKWLEDHNLVSRRSTLGDRKRDKRSFETMQTTQEGMKELLNFRSAMKILGQLNL